jgi:hypothetical protein
MKDARALEWLNTCDNASPSSGDVATFCLLFVFGLKKVILFFTGIVPREIPI